MHRPRPRLTLATQILGLQLAVLVIAVLFGALAGLWLIRSELDRQYQQRALAVAASVAALPEIRAAVLDPNGYRVVQPLADSIRKEAGASFVVVTDVNGIRLSHPNPALIGQSAIAPGEPPVALSGQSYTATETGSLGASARGKTPIWDDNGHVVGMVSVGYPEIEVNAGLGRLLPLTAGYLLVALILGVAASWMLARHLKRQTFGLEPQEIAMLLEQREAMLHGIREGTIAVDRSSRVTLVNDEARRLLGLYSDAVGQPLEDVVPAGRVRDVLTGTAEGPEQIVLSGGRILVANRMPIILRDGVSGSVTTFRDRTELSGLHRELQGLRGFTDALRAQVHDFSNRLHTIAGLIELGRGDEAIRLATEAATVHQELAERLVERVGDPLLGALLLAKAAIASESAIDLRLSDDTLISSERADARDLVTILGNLIDNALDAVRSNPPTAPRWVDVQLLEEADAIVLCVSDSGLGIDPLMSQRVFDEGYSTKDVTGRTRGLGLALVRQIVERRGGTIQLENGPGAIFAVRLPRHETAPARPTRAGRVTATTHVYGAVGPSEQPAVGRGPQFERRFRAGGSPRTSPCQPRGGHLGHPHRVDQSGSRGTRTMIRTLIVDDDFRVADVHRAYVQRLPGFLVVGDAHTAGEALESISRLRPDLVLLDLYLPDLPGLEVLRRIQTLQSSRPDVVVVTAARDVDSLRAAMQGGVIHYLVKPFSFRVFEEKLMRYADVRSRLSRLAEADQAEVDRLFSMLRTSPEGADLPKGVSVATLRLIVDVLSSAPGDLSATEIAQAAGVSRVTARRYLDELARGGRVELTLQYGAPGRPEHRYRLGSQAARASPPTRSSGSMD